MQDVCMVVVVVPTSMTTLIHHHGESMWSLAIKIPYRRWKCNL